MLNATLATVFDSAGNLYIADSGNCVVRRVDAKTGVITTVAGTGIGGYTGDNGPATSAELDYPSGLAMDGAGNLYISDFINGVVRMVAAGTGTITTYAGSPTATTPGDNGPATSAQIIYPVGLAFDANGDLYIGSEFRVRKVATATGTITTVAGNGDFGYTGDGGAATSATLSFQVGSILFDGKGNMFFADSDNDAIREVAAGTGIISTVAGKGYAYSGSLYSGDGGPATSAQLNFPNGISLDPAGNLYIADTTNSVIREVTASNGIINTIVPGCSSLSGDGGPTTSSGVCEPYDLKFDGAGNLYVAEEGGRRVRLITAAALPPTRTTSAPVFNSPAGTYENPQQVIITSNTPEAEIYVTLDGSTPTTTYGEYHGPIPVTGSITLQAVAVAPGYLPSAPVTATYTITNPPIASISTVAGTGVYGTPQAGAQAISSPMGWMQGIAVDANGDMYVPDARNYVVWKIAANTGTMQVVAGTLGSFGTGGNGGLATAAQVWNPTHVTLDSLGNLYISDTAANQVRKVTASTGVITLYAGSGAYYGDLGDGGPATSGRLNYPEGLVVDNAGNLYIADQYNNRVRMVNPDGVITTVAGSGNYGTLGDGGPSASANLSQPMDVAVDNLGNIFIADSGNSRVREVIAATGNISTVAGDGNRGSSGDGGSAVRAELYPLDIALDPSGNLYISDYYTSVRKVDAASGVIRTVAGSGFSGFNGDGISATMADLCASQGVALDPFGSLYIADSCDYRIRKVTFRAAASAPVFSLAAGNYQGTQTLTLTDSTPGASIYYTTDGSTPATASTAYSGAISISSTETVQAIAVATGLADSPITSATFVVQLATATPTFTPAAGTYASAQRVTISDSTNGATIYYTTNGTTPTTYSTEYSGPITVSSSETIEAIATASGDSISGVTIATYTIAVPGFTLMASPASVSVVQGGSATSTITVADVAGFSGSVALTAGSLPSGVTASFAPGATSGTRVLTLTASGSAAVTSSPVSVTITGTSGSLSASTSIALTIASPPTFSSGSSGTTSITVKPGATTGNTGTISVQGRNGFSGAVNLSCTVTASMSGVNDMPTCSLNPPTVNIAGTAAQTSTLTVNTTAASSSKNELKELFWPSAGETTLALLLFFAVPRRWRGWSALLLLLALGISFGVTGCGGGSHGGGGAGGGTNSGTTPGTYTITVTGTSGTISAKVGTITLTVQ